jgi:hypothetical protein
MWQFAYPEGFGFGHGFEMSAVAKNLAEHGTFGNPFEPAVTGPTAVVPPLYPLFLAVFIKLLKRPVIIASAATVANAVVNALIAALMPRIAAVFFGDAASGIVAGVLWIFAMRLMPQWDVSYTIAGLVLFCLYSAKSMGSGRGPLRSAAWAGCIGGLLTLMNPAVVTVFLPWVLFLLILRRVPAGAAVRYLAVVVLAVGLCNVPWAVRNYRIWHAFTLRTNFGMTLYASNNSCAESSLSKVGMNGCYQSTHPVASESEIRLLRSLGEVEYDRLRTAAAVAWIRSHFGRYCQLTLHRIIEFWFPEVGYPAYPAYVIWVITVLSVPGVILMAKRREPVTWFLLAVWLIYPLMYYSVVSGDRYRYPILWTSILAAAYCLHAVYDRFKDGRILHG